MGLGEILKLLRSEKNITQQELADHLEVGRATIAGYETKNKQPDYDKLLIIADYFDVSVDFLLGRTDVRKYLTAEDIGVTTVAAHANKDLTKEEQHKILEYIKFIKSQRD